MSPKPIDAEQLAVRDLARQADPLDMMARLMVAGHTIGAPCEACRSTGTIACKHPRHTTVDVAYQTHTCLERDCPECSLRRRSILLASIEADRIRHEEYDHHGHPLPRAPTAATTRDKVSPADGAATIARWMQGDR